jgi:hypothetical protein
MALLSVRLKLRLESGKFGKGRIGVGPFLSRLPWLESFSRRPLPFLPILAVHPMLRATLPHRPSGRYVTAGLRSLGGCYGCCRLGEHGITAFRRGISRGRLARQYSRFATDVLCSAALTRANAVPVADAGRTPDLDHLRLVCRRRDGRTGAARILRNWRVR